MHGYLGRPEEADRTIVDGWLHTGDVSRLDEDGYLTLVDRIKDMIIRGARTSTPRRSRTHSPPTTESSKRPSSERAPRVEIADVGNCFVPLRVAV
jgi:hypothetical protein